MSQTNAPHTLMHACTAWIAPWCHRPMHAATAWALLFWFHLGYTFISNYLHQFVTKGIKMFVIWPFVMSAVKCSCVYNNNQACIVLMKQMSCISTILIHSSPCKLGYCVVLLWSSCSSSASDVLLGRVSLRCYAYYPHHFCAECWMLLFLWSWCSVSSCLA